MYLYKKIKISILAILITIFNSGCGGGSSTTSTEATISTSTPAVATLTRASKAIHKGQVKDSSTGEGLANVKVSIGKANTITDTNGFYALSNLSINKEAVVNFEKNGYLLGSTHIQLKSLTGDNTTSDNYLEYSIYPHDYQYNYNSNKEITSPRINIDASVSYINTDGKPYTGTTRVKLTILDNNEKTLLASFPGLFKGINTNGILVQFETYGLISILLEDDNGNRLDFAENEIATLIFDTVSSLEKPDTLPLWYYDYVQGLWMEEGYAQLQENGSYKGEISHLGTWSLNRPLDEEAGIYRGRIINKDGLPMSDIRLHATGSNWVSSDLSTDEDGIFEIEVIPGSSFQLEAYDYNNKYGATYSARLPAIASGEIIED